MNITELAVEFIKTFLIIFPNVYIAYTWFTRNK